MQYIVDNCQQILKLKVPRTCIFPIAPYGCATWLLRKLDIKRINALEIKYYLNILHISSSHNYSFLNELHLPTNWLHNFVSRQQSLILWPRYTTQWFREYTNARNGSRKREPRKAKTTMGEIITYTFRTIAAASNESGGGQAYISHRHLRHPEKDII